MQGFCCRRYKDKFPLLGLHVLFLHQSGVIGSREGKVISKEFSEFVSEGKGKLRASV